MTRIVAAVSAAWMVGGTAVFAQAPSFTAAEQTQSRYQIGQMERILEGAVEHGAKVWRDRVQSTLPADMLLTENAKARGFRLEEYGVVFDVQVPSIQTAMLWSFRTLDQNDLGLTNALDALRSFVEKTGDPNVQQALKRVELQVAPASPSLALPSLLPTAPPLLGGARTTTSGSAPIAAERSSARDAQNAAAVDPQEAFRSEVKNALMDAMLDHSRGLDVAPGEWLVVAARSSDDRPSLAPADNDARTVIIRVSGADLTAFLGAQIGRDEAKNRMVVRVF